MREAAWDGNAEEANAVILIHLSLPRKRRGVDPA